jgi:hypothetical protein
MRNSNRDVLATCALAGALAFAPMAAPASVIIVSNGSGISVDTLAEVLYPPPPVTDSDTQSLAFPTATSLPGSFGDDLVAHAEVAGGGPPGRLCLGGCECQSAGVDHQPGRRGDGHC